MISFYFYFYYSLPHKTCTIVCAALDQLDQGIGKRDQSTRLQLRDPARSPINDGSAWTDNEGPSHLLASCDRFATPATPTPK